MQTLPKLATACLLVAFGSVSLHGTNVTARLLVDQNGRGGHYKAKKPPAVLWLNSVQSGSTPAFAPGTFTLLQKNKTFIPHLLVVPAGSSVAFPNADPFFHNVFSLFDGKRFDLGLYESGTSRSVVFSKVGVSYIFCDIHSEMSAVVIALTTPYFSIADSSGVFLLPEVPDGDYDLHVWIEGERPSLLESRTRRIRVAGATMNAGDIRIRPSDKENHLDKFGHPYETESTPIY